MSAENSRLTRAIQRIAREDPELRRAIDATKPRGDQAGGQGVGESDGERDRICCDGSTNENSNPGTSELDTGEGGQGGLDPNDPANLESGPGELTSVVDCATGQPVCFDGDGFIPPNGWESPSSPPIHESYIEGTYYIGVGLTSYRGPTALNVYGQLPDSRAVNNCVGTYGTKTSFEKSVGDNLVWRAVYVCDQNPDVKTGTSIQPASCNGSAADYCNPSDADLRVDSWPSDGCVNLAIIDGSIVGSKYDPENDGSYSAPRDEIELCDPENGTSILIRPSADGGWKSIKSLSGDIDPDTGAGYLYRPNGQRVRQISPSEFRDDTV